MSLHHWLSRSYVVEYIMTSTMVGLGWVGAVVKRT